MSEDRPETRFYYMRWLKWMLRCYGAVAALIFLSLTAESIPVVLGALSGGFALIWFSITWFAMAASIGVEVRRDGIRIGARVSPAVRRMARNQRRCGPPALSWLLTPAVELRGVV